MTSKQQTSFRLCHALILTTLLAAGAIIRVFGAWCYRNNTDPDTGIVSLMVKHMLEGKDFPVFFYGQAYMGSLEPAISALVSLVIGLSGFSITLGPALLSIAMLVVVYLWARDAAGSKAAVLALSYALVGPHYAFAFQCLPRGGYVITLVLGVLLVWLPCRYFSSGKDRVPPGRAWLFLIGLLAGVGWWTNQLITYALLTSGIIFLLALKKHTFSLRLVYGLGGFILGSLPLWIWNAKNDWKTLAFLRSPGGTDLGEGLEKLFSQRLLSYFDVAEASLIVQSAVLGFHALLLISAAVMLVQTVRNRANGKQWLHQVAPWIFFGVVTLLYATSNFSRFSTARYLVPLAPALAVAIGIGSARLADRLPWKMGYLPVLILIGLQLRTIPYLVDHEAVYARRTAAAKALGNFLTEQELTSTYTPFMSHWLNFSLRERFVFTDFKGDRYAPYAIRAEQDERAAILNNYGHVNVFLESTRGEARTDHVLNYNITHQWSPPSDGRQELVPHQWEDVSNAKGLSIIESVGDRNLDTYWTSDAGEDSEWLDITFPAPTEVSAVRMLSGNSRFNHPSVVQVFARSSDSEKLIRLTRKLRQTGFYWSGPRPYWGGAHYRYDINLPATTVTGLRILRTENRQHAGWWLAELQVFSPDTPPGDGRDAVDELQAVLRSRDIDALYCDRWLANRIHKATAGSVRTPLEMRAYGDEGLPHKGPMQLTRTTAILCLRENAEVCRTSLKTLSIATRESTIGPWVLFDFDSGRWDERYGELVSLYWEGFACFVGGAKAYAAQLIADARQHIAAEGVSPQAVDALLKAVRLEPNFITALPELAGWMEEAGLNAEASQVRMKYTAAMPNPMTSIPFENGVEFLGVHYEGDTLSTGSETSAKYFWRCPTNVNAHGLAVFVHLAQGGALFQNDHVLLSEIRDRELSYQPLPEVFCQTVRLAVPPSIPPGTYNITMGIYDRMTGKRIAPKTDLQNENDAVTLPLVINIKSPSSS